MNRTRTKRSRLAGYLTLAAALCLTLPSSTYAAKQQSLNVDAGKTTLVCDADEGTLSLQSENISIEGEGKWTTLKGDVVAFSLPLGSKKLPAIVGAINPSPVSTVCEIRLKDVGLSSGAGLAGFDLIGNTYTAPIRGTLTCKLPPRGIALVAVAQPGKIPALLCTSATLSNSTAGAAAAQWDKKSGTLCGTSILKEDASLELRFFVPMGKTTWKIKDASANGSSIGRIMQTASYLRATLNNPQSEEVDWQFQFEKSSTKKTENSEIVFSAEALGGRRVRLCCYSQGKDMLIRRSDGVSLIQRGTYMDDTSVSPGTDYVYTVHPLSWGRTGKALASCEVSTPPLPPIAPLPDPYLSDLDPVKAVNGWNGDPRRDKSIDENPICLRGEIFEKGMGVHAYSELIYEVKPSYKRFVSVVGVDDEKGAGSVVFKVKADDKIIFETGKVTFGHEWIPIDVKLPAGTKQIHLIVEDGGDGIGCDHADWANAGFVK